MDSGRKASEGSRRWVDVARRIGGCLPFLVAAQASAAPIDFVGPGVFAFATAQPCPLVVAGPSAAASAAPGGCNRIALDDAGARASLDPDARVIRFADTRTGRARRIVGDVLLQGSGVSEAGVRVPLNLHVVVDRAGRRWSVNSHAHAPVRGDFTDIRVEAYRIDVDGADGTRTLVAAESIGATMASPTLAARLAGHFIQVRDRRAAPSPSPSPSPDIVVAVGVGQAAVPVLRARLDLDASAGGDLPGALQRGTWRLRLTALQRGIRAWVVRRELFLFGMDEEAVLQPVVGGGFAKGMTLDVGAVDGRGYLRYGDREQPFAKAAETGLRYLQQSFVGLALAGQLAEPRRVAPR